MSKLKIRFDENETQFQAVKYQFCRSFFVMQASRSNDVRCERRIEENNEPYRKVGIVFQVYNHFFYTFYEQTLYYR